MRWHEFLLSAYFWGEEGLLWQQSQEGLCPKNTLGMTALNYAFNTGGSVSVILL